VRKVALALTRAFVASAASPPHTPYASRDLFKKAKRALSFNGLVAAFSRRWRKSNNRLCERNAAILRCEGGREGGVNGSDSGALARVSKRRNLLDCRISVPLRGCTCAFSSAPRGRRGPPARTAAPAPPSPQQTSPVTPPPSRAKHEAQQRRPSLRLSGADECACVEACRNGSYSVLRGQMHEFRKETRTGKEEVERNCN
jgi:hypothetical protein